MPAYLTPIENPRNPLLKLGFRFAARKFGKVPGPFAVFCARMPLSFTSFYGKVSRLDRRLALPADTAILVRERVAATNVCHYCMDAARWFATSRAPHMLAKLDALEDHRTSALFTAAERAAIDYATELTERREVRPETFAALARHFSEREICDIVWLVASEHLYNITNIGLNIGSDGMCEIALARRGGAAAGAAAA